MVPHWVWVFGTLVAVAAVLCNIYSTGLNYRRGNRERFTMDAVFIGVGMVIVVLNIYWALNS